MLPALEADRPRLDTIDRWSRWEQAPIELPDGATKEMKWLRSLVATPWLGLVVTSTAQTMFVAGFRSSDSGETSPSWRLWQANDFDQRQIAVHRAMLAYGQSYVTALPGVDLTGERTAVFRGASPRKMVAFYRDPVVDDWPVYAARRRRVHGMPGVDLFDAEAVYTIAFPEGADAAPVVVDVRGHGIGVCPVVRYQSMPDLDGRSPGDVEPFIPLAQRINKTSFDRMLAQHYSSWVVRTVAGMTEPDDETASRRKKLELRQSDLLVAEDPDTKFGSLPATPLDGFIRAHEADIKTLAAATQTPVYALVGDLINLSADALAGARAAADAKSEERKLNAGRAHAQLLRLGAAIVGDEESARDVSSRIVWRDTSIRSMASAADALGKIAQMLGVPPRGLWPLIPGVTESQLAEWRALAEQPDELDQLLSHFLEDVTVGAD